MKCSKPCRSSRRAFLTGGPTLPLIVTNGALLDGADLGERYQSPEPHEQDRPTHLPMWAYHGSNFAGMCLEFDTADLMISDFHAEKLRPVTYARATLCHRSRSPTWGRSISKRR